MQINLNQTHKPGGIMSIVINKDNVVLSSTINVFDAFKREFKDELFDIEGDLECYHCGMNPLEIMEQNSNLHDTEVKVITFYSDEQNDNYVCDDDICFANAAREADGSFEYQCLEVELQD